MRKRNFSIKHLVYTKIKNYVFHHSGIRYQQVRMLTLLQNRHRQLFCIKNEKFQLKFYFSSYEISFFRLFGGNNKNEKKILLGFVKHTFVK